MSALCRQSTFTLAGHNLKQRTIAVKLPYLFLPIALFHALSKKYIYNFLSLDVINLCDELSGFLMSKRYID